MEGVLLLASTINIAPKTTMILTRTACEGVSEGLADDDYDVKTWLSEALGTSSMSLILTLPDSVSNLETIMEKISTQFENHTVSVSSILGGASDNTGSSIARRLGDPFLWPLIC
ncbi:hypothetical protein Dimus_006278 [Dionaea muscipula]